MDAAVVRPSYAILDGEVSGIRTLTVGKQLTEAHEALDKLTSACPDSGRLWQEWGHYFDALGQPTAAIAAYRRAVSLNDALPDSWSRLTTLCRSMSLDGEALEASRAAERLAGLPPPLAWASLLLNEGDVETAEKTVRSYLAEHGAHVEGMRILAQISIKLNVLDDAEMLLEHILIMEPAYAEAQFEYAAVLAQRRRHLHALQVIRPLLQRSPDNCLYLTLYAQICDGLGESAEALRVYRRLSDENPADTGLLVSMAHLLKTRGDTPGAIDVLRTAARSPASYSGACLALSNTKSYRFTAGELSAMRAAEAAPATSRVDRYQLAFALGKALEDHGCYEESFSYYALGNALKRSEINVDPGFIERTMQRQAATCTPAFFASRRGFGCPRPDPIFIVGMPRAGSTLLEQILASHSQIDATLELPDIPRLVHQFRDRDKADPPRYPAILAELAADELALLGETYLADTQVYRQGAPYFVDKTPSNFRDIGLIHLILPNARIIDARREPMACCFGNFKQLFTGMEFNYSLQEIGRYYCGYVTLMEHWDRALPGKILRVQHEDVVNDLEGSVRRVLDYLGLPFESACLEFYKTARAVRTLSSEQVRRPIYREGLDQWRHFEPWLGPLKAALAPLLRP